MRRRPPPSRWWRRAGTNWGGLAWSIPSLIVFRLIQGIGAAAAPVIGLTTFLSVYVQGVLNQSVLVAGLGSVVIGLGMGFLSTSAIVIIQDSVGWAERGSATASNIFSRNLGSTLGAAVLGAVLNASLAQRVNGAAAAPPTSSGSCSTIPRA